MSGRKVHKVKETLFVALPLDARRTIEGGCQCPYCKAHPESKAAWDTLAMAASGNDRTWIVHYPEIASLEN